MREQVASFYLYSISFLGLIAVIISLFISEMPSESHNLLLLIMFMGITEYFPIRIWKRRYHTQPYAYLSNELAVWNAYNGYCLCVCDGIIHIPLRRLPIQRTVFNCTQLALSIALAEWFSNECISFFISEMNLSVLYEKLISLFLFSVFFCLFNTLFTIF